MKRRRWLKACLGSPLHRRSRREEAHISTKSGTDQSLLTSAPTISRHALRGLRRAGLLYGKVCAKREDFGDATGARTFLSAAAPEYSTGSKRSRALLPFDVAADKNVRAPLWFRLRRPGDSAPYLRSLIGCYGEGEIYGPKGFWLKTLNSSLLR